MDLDVIVMQFNRYRPMLEEMHEAWTAHKAAQAAAAKEAEATATKNGAPERLERPQ